MPKYEINPAKRYSIPEEVSVVYHNEKYLVIAPDIACWIVLDNQEQVDIVHAFMNGLSIGEIMSNQAFKNADIALVVTQIEARRFYIKEVHSSTEDERSLHIYLTNQCNLSCPHCYMFSGKARDGEMTTEEIIKLLHDYKTIAKGSNVTFSGGEPTIRSDFDVIVKKAAEFGLKVKILSNGVLLTNERVAQLSSCIDSVQVSIDGFSEDSNSKVRGKGHFEKALSAIKTLISYGINTSIAITPPYDMLKGHKEDYISFARDLMQQYSGKSLDIKFAGELLSGRLINPSKSQKNDYLSLIEDVQRVFYGPDYDVALFARQFYFENIMDNCMYGVFSISSNGDVYFCARTGDLQPVANIRDTPFDEILLKSATAEKATLVTRLEPCKKCNLRYICGGGCRIDEFPELVNRTSYDKLDYESIPPRKCDDSIKFHFYDLMIRSNKYLYHTLPMS